MLRRSNVLRGRRIVVYYNTPVGGTSVKGCCSIFAPESVATSDVHKKALPRTSPEPSRWETMRPCPAACSSFPISTNV